MSSDTGTRQLADGMPGVPARPSRGRRARRRAARAVRAASTTCRLVGGTLGSTHMALTLVSLVEGHVDEHVHSYESSFYVLEGEPVLYLDGRGVELEPGACGAMPVGRAARVSLATAARSGSRWPRRGRASTAATRSSSGRAPDAAAEPLDARDPRNRNLFLLSDGETDLDRLKQRARRWVHRRCPGAWRRPSSPTAGSR